MDRGLALAGAKPEIICLENLRNEREQSHFVFFLLEGRCGQAVLAHVHGPRWRESDHTRTPSLLFGFRQPFLSSSVTPQAHEMEALLCCLTLTRLAVCLFFYPLGGRELFWIL